MFWRMLFQLYRVPFGGGQIQASFGRGQHERVCHLRFRGVDGKVQHGSEQAKTLFSYRGFSNCEWLLAYELRYTQLWLARIRLQILKGLVLRCDLFSRWCSRWGWPLFQRHRWLIGRLRDWSQHNSLYLNRWGNRIMTLPLSACSCVYRRYSWGHPRILNKWLKTNTCSHDSR